MLVYSNFWVITADFGVMMAIFLPKFARKIFILLDVPMFDSLYLKKHTTCLIKSDFKTAYTPVDMI